MMATTKLALVTTLLHSKEQKWQQEADKLQHLSPADFVDYACTLTDPRIESLLMELRRIDAALCQYDIGLYGICSDCEDTIDLKRLNEDPCVQRCGKCEAKRRSQKRQDLFAL